MSQPKLWLVVSVGVCLALAACGSDEATVAGGSTRALVTTSSTSSAPSSVAAPSESTVLEREQGSPESFGIDEVIRFDPGGTSATISDAVVRGERNRYVLDAAVGQTMNVAVVSLEDNAVFDVYGPDDALLAREATTASIVLPSDGTYAVILGGTRGNASYDLTVEIPAG